MQPDQDIPDPHQDWRGPRQQKPKNLLRQVYKWAFTNLLVEPLATIAFYAVRVMDKRTGIPYSADELETKILAAVVVPAHTHTSSGITDASFGGNAAADSGKVAKFDSVGALACSYRFTIFEPAGQYKWDLVQGLAITQNREIKLYDADGFLVLGKPFLDQSAAISGGIQVGDIWFDLTLNKPRVRLS